jgi:hypothetical protein
MEEHLVYFLDSDVILMIYIGIGIKLAASAPCEMSVAFSRSDRDGEVLDGIILSILVWILNRTRSVSGRFM